MNRDKRNKQAVSNKCLNKLSKEDQEEQANAKILEANDAKIAKNEAALKKDIDDTE